MRISKLIRISLASVWSNKMRSFLTMLGIIIGISSVSILVGIGEGTKKQVTEQIESLGTNLITVSITGNRTKAITNEELEELKTKPGIKEIAPALSQGNINVKAGTTSKTTTLEASTANYADIRKLAVASGRFINDNDDENRYKVAVIGSETATNLFSTTNVVGKTMYISGIEFKIIGVLESQGTSATGSSDDRVIIPLQTAQRLLQTTTVKTFYAEATDKDSVSEAKSYLTLFLNKKYDNNTNSYRIMDQTSLLETASSTTSSLTTMLGGIAAISLVVGGIGIMNIMLVSVIERTREIGIRKAIGAKRGVILTQFLIEAATISTLGGIFGVLIGFLGAYVAQNFFNLSVSISNNIVIGAFIFSFLVGVVFGIYPANKASKLNPIDALRFE
ncbi:MULTISPECIES: ABC transporter permease [Clostridium]|uniref:ABC transporter permease n=1 Tax=Clostridium intestinale TaxID=36845 RepID=A0A7D6VQF1_9CLOT|nr:MULTISPECIES: ABC transporter permease [Clostridium]QLY80356.1 ABC transporter permease [Clostridium intestinale]WRY51023.1 ABC transporter permease [Clostridium intestinale]